MARSTPCAPARRDIYTGRYEFLERGWGPMEDGDAGLPEQVSGPPNQSMLQMEAEGHKVSQLITDHVNMWRKGMGNYHMGYTGFEFIRGHLEDNWRTDPVAYYNPDDDHAKTERHFRNVEFIRDEALGDEENHFAARVFSSAAEWLERNHDHDDFYLHIDCYDPHEPWDPPEELLEQFDPRGYDVDTWESHPPYDEWEDHYSRDELRHMQARYAAMVVLVDRWLGRLFDAMDDLGLWEDTLVIFTTDHGT
ncbi:sulfatase-like hydrolase/transferase [Halobium palmae]|uniref:Sulfatase-like hydrolase/transferase n=1 Tax=Halobium palmae TaxID=1776492 RepID=A0ABD5RW94_9EURY